MSALGMKTEEELKLFGGLVHFPAYPCYLLNVNDPVRFNEVYKSLIYRASYLAKKETKYYDDGNRWFGCSRR